MNLPVSSPLMDVDRITNMKNRKEENGEGEERGCILAYMLRLRGSRNLSSFISSIEMLFIPSMDFRTSLSPSREDVAKILLFRLI